MPFIMLLLTCATKAEAERISIELIERRLIACAKMMPVHSIFQWEGAVQGDDEIMLIMETSQELCQDIEEVVRSLHSYKTFVLTGIPVVYASKNAQEWLHSSLATKL
jgi:periplasmic divalent cation tolerance protein